MNIPQFQFNQKASSDYENESHIARKKKAIAKQISSKNQKKILELIDNDEDNIEEYARFIR